MQTLTMNEIEQVQGGSLARDCAIVGAVVGFCCIAAPAIYVGAAGVALSATGVAAFEVVVGTAAVSVGATAISGWLGYSIGSTLDSASNYMFGNA